MKISLHIQKIDFITFGGPSERYHQHVSQLLAEAKDFNVFTNMTGLTELDYSKIIASGVNMENL